ITTRGAAATPVSTARCMARFPPRTHWTAAMDGSMYPHHGASGMAMLDPMPADAAARPAPAPPAPATLEAFLDGIAARAFRFAEAGLRHREDALDAVQDAMLKMLGYRDRPAEEWTPLFWTILRSRIVDAQRRRTLRLGWMTSADERQEI